MNNPINSIPQSNLFILEYSLEKLGEKLVAPIIKVDSLGTNINMIRMEEEEK